MGGDTASPRDGGRRRRSLSMGAPAPTAAVTRGLPQRVREQSGSVRKSIGPAPAAEVPRENSGVQAPHELAPVLDRILERLTAIEETNRAMQAEMERISSAAAAAASAGRATSTPAAASHPPAESPAVGDRPAFGAALLRAAAHARRRSREPGAAAPGASTDAALPTQGIGGPKRRRPMSLQARALAETGAAPPDGGVASETASDGDAISDLRSTEASGRGRFGRTGTESTSMNSRPPMLGGLQLPSALVPTFQQVSPSAEEQRNSFVRSLQRDQSGSDVRSLVNRPEDIDEVSLRALGCASPIARGRPTRPESGWAFPAENTPRSHGSQPVMSSPLQEEDLTKAVSSELRSNPQVQSPQATPLHKAWQSFHQVVSGQTLLLSDGLWVTILDVMFLLAAMFESVEVGVHIGSHSWDADPPTSIVVLMSCANLVSVLWVLTHFRTATLIGWELIDADADKVVRTYLQGHFALDVIPCVPLDLAALASSTTAYRVLQCIRLLRIARLHTLFRSSNPLTTTRGMRGVLHLCLYLLGHHAMAVIWMILSDQNDHYTSWQVAMYWAVQTTTSVGYGDLPGPPDSDGLRWYAILCMAGGVATVSYFISVSSVTLLNSDVVEQKTREKKQQLLSLMLTYDIPWVVQKEAMVLYPSILAATQDDFAEVIKVFPPFIQEKIGLYIRLKLLRQVPMFKGAELACVEDLSDCMEEDIFQPMEYIMRAGEMGREMFFLAHGVVEVLVEDPGTGEEHQVCILRDGSWFGEIAILKEGVRTASVRTITACDLFCLGKEDFQRILDAHPDSDFARQIRAELDRRLQATAVATTGRRTSEAKPAVDSGRNGSASDPGRGAALSSPEPKSEKYLIGSQPADDEEATSTGP
eukprot:TRINITY_DN9368_c0_g1_i1.p1 TRINITY_DN9368_c0_g1~~TRINITY_DN9368_c0_g1_i1.p1  ORF type:complete len:899 (+),score=212.55 TRINITY_DN9368_c0_g1_i1:79-2697(+)